MEHLRRREAEKDVGTGQDVGELARLRRLRIARLVVVHLLPSSAVDDPGDVGDPDVLLRYAEQYEEVEARKRGGTGARADELDVLQLLADDAQAVRDRGADDDRRAVLVIVGTPGS